MAGYRDDMAYIHDVGLTGFARSAAPGVVEVLHGHGVTSGLVVDLGCGTGDTAKSLLEAGYDCFGVDIAPAMIEIARRKVPGAKFEVGSFLKVPLPSCQAVSSIGQSLGYLFDEDHDMKELLGLFERVFEALEPGGVFVFDVLEASRDHGSEPFKFWQLGEDWAVLVDVGETTDQDRMKIDMTTFRQVGELYRRDDETHHVQLYHRDEMLEELERLGFEARAVPGYGGHRFPDWHVGFIAHKPRA